MVAFYIPVSGGLVLREKSRERRYSGLFESGAFPLLDEGNSFSSVEEKIHKSDLVRKITALLTFI